MRMKAKIISVGLVILLMGLTGFGCYPREEINDMEAQIAELEAQIADLREEYSELQKEVKELQEELPKADESEKPQEELPKVDESEKPAAETVKIEMTFEPNPVPCQQDEWRWLVTLEEVNGIGVTLSDITMETWEEGHIAQSWSDKGWLDAIDHYLPAYGSVGSNRRIPYQQSITHVIFIVTGVDDNGQAVIAKGRVDLSQKKEGTAEIEVSFSANPVPCENGMWEWRAIFTEVTGIGVALENLEICVYRNSRLLRRDTSDKDYLERWLLEVADFPNAYLPGYGKVDSGGRRPCQDITHMVYTLTGIDDNGNEITAEGRVELER